MILYILFFLVVFCFFEFDRKFKKISFNSLLFVFMFLFFMSAIRFDVGWDYVNYYNIIEMNIDYYDSQFMRLELFNRYLILLSQYLGFTQLFFIITSFIIIFSFYSTFKKYSSEVIISTLLFISLPIFFFSSFSIIRQYTAIGIIFYSFRFIQARQSFRFIIFLVIASCFHKSAIVAFPLYFLYLWKPKFYFFPIIYIFGFFSSDLLYWSVAKLVPQYLKFLEKSIGVGGDKVLLLFQVIGFMLLFFTHRLQKRNVENNFYFLSFFIGLFIWSSLSKYGHAGFRGSLYYIVFFLLLIPNIVAEFKQKVLIRELTYVICFYFFVLTLYLGKVNPKKDPNIPYQSFFFKDKFDFKKIE